MKYYQTIIFKYKKNRTDLSSQPDHFCIDRHSGLEEAGDESRACSFAVGHAAGLLQDSNTVLASLATLRPLLIYKMIRAV